MTAAVPNRSARILGESYNLTAPEMNLALKKLGFLDGEPGAYSVTERGLPFAVETLKDRGSGGYPSYNPSWIERTWNSGIDKVLHVTPELKETVRAEAAALRQQQRAATLVAREASAPTPPAAAEIDPLRLVMIVGGAILVGVSAYGVWKVYERRRRRT